jgi:hypothetical protein
MWTTDARGIRHVAAWVSLGCAAMLLTACGSSASSSTTASTVSTASTASTGSAGAPASSAGSPGAQVSPTGSSSPGTPAAAASTTAAATGADTFLAAAADLNGTLLHEPACGGYGCALSGDSTAFLFNMTWTTWSGTEAVGTGTYKLDNCDPDCATGHVYPVATVVTLSQPVKACSPSGTRRVWSRASFTFPNGLPKALQGQNAPQNPWTFSALIAAAQHGCG